MAREDLKLIIDAERKNADERTEIIRKRYEDELRAFGRALDEIHAAHEKYKRRRNMADWVWTIMFVVMCFVIVLVLT